MVAAKSKMDRKTGLIIKQVIESVYTGGVDVLLSYKIDEKGNINGFFRDRGQNYSYTITPENILTYVEAEASRQDAAYLEGLMLTDYTFLSGKTSTYTQSALNAQLIKFDSGKADVCQKGKPCNGACIPRNRKCQQDLGLKESESLDKIRTGNIALTAEVIGVGTTNQKKIVDKMASKQNTSKSR